jgi:hypothetical protein
MAQSEDPKDFGQNILEGIPGYGILQMLKNAGRAIPEGYEQAKQFLGISPRPPVSVTLPPGQAMPVPRDAQGRPLPIDPATGLPINYPPRSGGSY